MSIPADYPQDYIKQVKLTDGRVVLLRPIRPDDAPRLQEGFRRLSKDSVYLRFLETFNELSDRQAHYFANVDYHHRMAIVGALQEDNLERLVAVARYDTLDEGPPGIADAAIVVRDDYQSIGLGSAAMQLLAEYARNNGIYFFKADILMHNQRILNFIRHSRLPYERKMLEPGIWSISVQLGGPEAQY
jgi:acetyltransferase